MVVEALELFTFQLFSAKRQLFCPVDGKGSHLVSDELDLLGTSVFQDFCKSGRKPCKQIAQIVDRLAGAPDRFRVFTAQLVDFLGCGLQNSCSVLYFFHLASG